MSEVLVINMCLVFKVYHVKVFIQQLLDEKIFVGSGLAILFGSGLAILFRPFGFIALKTLIWLSNLSILSMPGGGCSRDASCALNLISTFLLSSQK